MNSRFAIASVPLGILRRELAGAPRRRRFYWKRCLWVALGALVLFVGFITGEFAYRPLLGQAIFSSLCMSSLVAICILVSINAAALVIREREEETLPLLFLSGLSGWEFVLGKLLASLALTFFGLLSLLPMFMLAPSLGGVSAAQVVLAFAVLLSTASFVAAAAILVASSMDGTRAPYVVLTLAGIGYYTIFPPIVTGIAGIWFTPPTDILIPAISPFAAMFFVIDGSSFLPAIWNILGSLLLDILFFSTAAIVAARRAMRPPKASLPAIDAELTVVLPDLIRRFPVGPIVGDPIVWKDTHLSRGGIRISRRNQNRLLVGLLGPALGTWLVATLAETPLFVVGIASALYLVAFGIVGVVRLGRSFLVEKRDGALQILLATDLSDSEIVWGKLKAVVLGHFELPLTAALCVLPLWLVKVDATALFGLVVVLLLILCMCFGYFGFAMWLSLRTRNNIALPVGLLVWIGWKLLSGMILHMLFLDPSWILVNMLDAVFHLALGILCFRRVLASLRTAALRDND